MISLPYAVITLSLVFSVTSKELRLQFSISRFVIALFWLRSIDVKTALNPARIEVMLVNASNPVASATFFA